GHPCGDQLLCAVADRLREMLRPEDFVARFGGDEFVVFQQNIQSSEDAATLARRIVDRLSERYKIDNHLVEIGASVGIAMTSRGVSADTLLKNADMALYRAKADGRGTFCFFRDEMAQTVEARRILELDLRVALANEEFELFYQPLVNLKSGRIATCEALLRWNHPVRGVARLSADLGMLVVVEGIETNEQLELVSADGTVSEAQGYLFSRPVPAARIRQLLNASHARRLPDEHLVVLPARSIA